MNNILYRLQSSFQKNYSSIFTEMILIDLQRAFDTIDNKLLRKKEKYLGFSKNTIACFKSHICERKFKISINTSYFSPSNLLRGVTEGSIVGSLLLLVYLNNLPQVVGNNSLLYADDTCTVFQPKSINAIEEQLIREFLSFCDWFVDNKLSINFGQHKTKSELCGPKHKL